jgi:hypothetical protein
MWIASGLPTLHSEAAGLWAILSGSTVLAGINRAGTRLRDLGECTVPEDVNRSAYTCRRKNSSAALDHVNLRNRAEHRRMKRAAEAALRAAGVRFQEEA